MKARSSDSPERSKSRRQPQPQPRRVNAGKSGAQDAGPLSEDEADILYGEKHKDEKGIPWNQVKAKLDAVDR